MVHVMTMRDDGNAEWFVFRVAESERVILVSKDYGGTPIVREFASMADAEAFMH